jgi:hypothetical protein
MMPVMKNNMGPLYGAAGAASKQQRRTSETDASKRSKAQNISGSGGHRRKVRSEGPSLSTSPGSGVSVHPHASLQVPNGRGSSRPQPMARVRGSAPVLGGAASLPLHRHNSMPHGPQAIVGSAPTKPGSPTRSDSSSSSSESPASPTVTGKFHLKLIARLRRSLRIKDPAPPEAAVSTA